MPNSLIVGSQVPWELRCSEPTRTPPLSFKLLTLGEFGIWAIVDVTLWIIGGVYRTPVEHQVSIADANERNWVLHPQHLLLSITHQCSPIQLFGLFKFAYCSLSSTKAKIANDRKRRILLPS